MGRVECVFGFCGESEDELVVGMLKPSSYKKPRQEAYVVLEVGG